MADSSESHKGARDVAPEECLLCSSEIAVGADTMVYAGLRVHTDCYWRDIGIPPQRKRSSSGFRLDD